MRWVSAMGFLRPFIAITFILGWTNIHADTEDTITIVYGRVTDNAAVDVENHVKEGALVGGLLGVATASVMNTGSATGDVLAGSATGAATGAAIEYLGEWRMKGTRYSIASVNQGSIHIITDQTGVGVGDCVAIEASVKHANIRRVSDVYCEAISGIGDDQHLEMKAKESAADCHQAKKSLLSAETTEDLESAKRRVQALCDT